MKKRWYPSLLIDREPRRLTKRLCVSTTVVVPAMVAYVVVVVASVAVITAAVATSAAVVPIIIADVITIGGELVKDIPANIVGFSLAVEFVEVSKEKPRKASVLASTVAGKISTVFINLAVEIGDGVKKIYSYWCLEEVRSNHLSKSLTSASTSPVWGTIFFF